MSFETAFFGISGDAAAPLLLDAATIAHLAAMAVGLGSAVFADWTVLSRIALPLSADQLAVVRRAHRLIMASLVVLWLSGLSLLALKTEHEIARLTPKLVAKLGTVAMLTPTASAMAYIALPLVSANLGRRLTTLPLRQRCVLAPAAATADALSTGLMLLDPRSARGVLKPDVTADFR